MKTLTKVLRFIGFGGSSLDGILKMLTKLDKALEAYEAEEKEVIAEKQAKANRLIAEASDASREVERAARVRERITDFTS